MSLPSLGESQIHRSKESGGKWHPQGRVTGSDLGNGCFQFRFEKEEDLWGVLENRPYHFAYWMVIIQKWEPVISASFPFQIPFWIRIKGLPLHFWMDDMVRNIGKDLGTLQGHELTKTTARVKVLVDGLKPLTKEAIVEYDSREESLIYLEYEKLENHCSTCYSLSHLKNDCPANLKEVQRFQTTDSQRENEPTQKQTQSSDLEREYSSRDQRTERHTRPSYLPRNDIRDTTRQISRGTEFHERVDRHGNSFGPRVDTKQTRVPPPAKITNKASEKNLNWRNKEGDNRAEPQDYNSPPYTHKRQPVTASDLRKALQFPQRAFSEWRVKATSGLELTTTPALPETPQPIEPEESNTQYQNDQLATKEQAENQILGELNEATLQYLNCPDPT